MSYAEGTSVPIDRSRSEIERILTKAGSDQLSSGFTAEKAVVMFRLHGRHIRIDVPLAVYMKTKNKSGILLSKVHCDSENRRRWRAMVLYIKAKIESVESQIVSFEVAFMGHLVLPNSQTVGDFMRPQIESAYARGEMPKALPGY